MDFRVEVVQVDVLIFVAVLRTEATHPLRRQTKRRTLVASTFLIPNAAATAAAAAASPLSARSD